MDVRRWTQEELGDLAKRASRPLGRLADWVSPEPYTKEELTEGAKRLYGLPALPGVETGSPLDLARRIPGEMAGIVAEKGLGGLEAAQEGLRGAAEWAVKAPEATAAVAPPPQVVPPIPPPAPDDGDIRVRGGRATEEQVPLPWASGNIAAAAAAPAPTPDRADDIESIKRRLGFSWGKGVELGAGGRPTTSTSIRDQVGAAPGMRGPAFQARESAGGGGFVQPTQPSYVPDSMLEEASKRAQLAQSEAQMRDPYGIEPIRAKAEAEGYNQMLRSIIEGQIDVEARRSGDEFTWNTAERLIDEKLRADLEKAANVEGVTEEGYRKYYSDRVAKAREEKEAFLRLWKGRNQGLFPMELPESSSPPVG